MNDSRLDRAAPWLIAAGCSLVAVNLAIWIAGASPWHVGKLAFAGAFGGRADGSAGGLPPRLIWRNPFTPV